jgi:hypothetical protein
MQEIKPTEPSESPRTRRRWFTFRVKILLAAVAILAIALIVAKKALIGDPAISVEFVNQTTHPLQALEITYPGGVFKTKRLPPGTFVTGKLWPTGFRYHGGFKIDIAIKCWDVRLARPIQGNPIPYMFNSLYHEPNIRWTLMGFRDRKPIISIDGKYDYPTGKVRKFFRSLIHESPSKS